MRFEWDADKAGKNLKKHRISFEEAVTAFFDSDAVDDYDPEHSARERRYNLIGLSDDSDCFGTESRKETPEDL